ncbi:MAG: glutamine synthetase III [Oscillospiraceae bacterium]|nr:glutamine synthetase III [Oscillospiraceae bacterium]
MKFNLQKSFGNMVFNDSIMKEKLPSDTYKNLKNSIKFNIPLNPNTADIVANALKDWAIEKGATHFIHWFQPMTNITAGKHDSFISPQQNGNIILEFSGKELIKGEPDASSFPNGGIRNTFEARGYTAWDCTSPAFIKDNSLYIPTAFCSYTGEALDAKTPLLRSMESISKHAMRIIKIFGNKNSKTVIPTVGAEQEYFLIDREVYDSRLDLKTCGRTILGSPAVKGQEMEDHYCGRIRIRVSKFMQELDKALWEMGVYSKTKHNEVAPAQHELAPVFTSANIACDHNQLIMETMRIVAKKNNLACLLHEKPFKGINGSGKHNNWSLSTNDGQNLLEPGKTPYENLQFLIFISAIIKSIDKYSDLIKLSASSIGNEYRLGGNEAPPSIVSIFLGKPITDILNNIADGQIQQPYTSKFLETKVSTIPKFIIDNSDRNRTSPFAFTGNKFEFRMVGSSASVSFSTCILNTIITESLDQFATILENSKDIDMDIKIIISETMNNHGKIIFNGNSYSQEWKKEANIRGLEDISSTIDSINHLLDEKNINIFSKYNILSKSEIKSRYEIMMENYYKTISIEASVMIDMIEKSILPTTILYLGKLAKISLNLNNLSIENKYISKSILDISKKIDIIDLTLSKLKIAINDFTISSHIKKSVYYRDNILPILSEIREYTDDLEIIIDNKFWPIPSYNKILYSI